jgi:hypothetical protein
MEIEVIHWKEGAPYNCCCGHTMEPTYADHHYTESGLKDVTLLNNLKYVCPNCKEEDIVIKNIQHLHLTIASELIKRNPLKPEEFRFLKGFLNFDKNEKFKLGLDYHGVISANPIVFSNLTKILIESGQEVHIITGRRITDEFKKILEDLDIKYTHLFSIADHHFELNSPMTGYEEGQPKLIDELWNPTKAIFCEHEKINLHLDDSEVYGHYFKTPYLTYYKDDERTILRYLKNRGTYNG